MRGGTIQEGIIVKRGMARARERGEIPLYGGNGMGKSPTLILGHSHSEGRSERKGIEGINRPSKDREWTGTRVPKELEEETVELTR